MDRINEYEGNEDRRSERAKKPGGLACIDSRRSDRVKTAGGPSVNRQTDETARV